MKNPIAAQHSQTTGYQYNTRPMARLESIASDWHPKIRRLLQLDYAFLPRRYRNPGFLFRGIEMGMAATLRARYLGLNCGSHSLAVLERELEMMLVSADFSDAFSVARLWQQHGASLDGGIFVIDAELFAERHREKEAAILGFADPGVIFNYPFFASPLTILDVSYFILPQALVNYVMTNEQWRVPDMAKRCVVVDDDLLHCSRQELEQRLVGELDKRGVIAAKAEATSAYPKRER